MTTEIAAPAAAEAPPAAVAPADTMVATPPAAVVPGEAPAAAEAPPAAAPQAPEKYDFKTADGKVDPAVLTKFEGLARELNMTQEQASKFIDQIAPEMATAQKARHETQVGAWADATKSDKELGGDKLGENMAVAQKALAAFGTPELTKMLNESGLGNHPEIIRAFYRAGLKISPSNFVPAGNGTSQAASASSKLYPTMK